MLGSRFTSLHYSLLLLVERELLYLLVERAESTEGVVSPLFFYFFLLEIDDELDNNLETTEFCILFTFYQHSSFEPL